MSQDIVKRKYRNVAIPYELASKIENFILRDGTYRSISEFVIEAARIRLNELENSHRPPRGEEAVAEVVQ